MKRLLNLPFFYQAFTKCIGGNEARRFFVEHFVAPQPGWRILDIGCGTGELLHYLPSVEYVGLDINEKYIAIAKQQLGNRGTFLCQGVDKKSINTFSNFDAVLAFGAIHHIDDQLAGVLFQIARTALKPDGKFVSGGDGCYCPGQSSVIRFLLAHDRGRYVRDEEGYTSFAKCNFHDVKVSFEMGKVKIPYTAITMICTMPRSEGPYISAG